MESKASKIARLVWPYFTTYYYCNMRPLLGYCLLGSKKSVKRKQRWANGYRNET